MEKLICSSCCAPIVPTNAKPFLTCDYCGTNVSNPYYDESAAAAAAREEKPDLKTICVQTLREMGSAQNLAALDPDCFGDPITGVDSARAALSIPDDQQVYFLISHTVLLIAFSDGLALTDGGLYYSCDGTSGCLSWEAFITGAISCTDENDGQDGVLRIGSTVEVPVRNEKDSRLARFLVDFHNHVYHQYTGQSAPASWCVTEAVAAPEEENPSLLGTVLPMIGTILGGATGRRQTNVRRAPTLHPTSRPTVRQDRRDNVQPPRPLHSSPHRRPVAPPQNPQPDRHRVPVNRPNLKGLPDIQRRPAINARPAVAPKSASPARPGANRPGTSARPGSNRPGNANRPGKPGRHR